MVKNFANSCKRHSARDDLRELLKPTTIYLGAVTSRDIRLVAPKSHSRSQMGSTSNLQFQNMDVCSQFNLITCQHQELWKLSIFPADTIIPGQQPALLRRLPAIT